MSVIRIRLLLLPLVLSPALALAQVDATPATDPARFIALDSVARTDAAAEDLARRIEAQAIAEAEAGSGEPVEVEGMLVDFADGRRLLHVALCGGARFGNLGCHSSLFTMPAGGAAFVRVLDLIGSGPIWFDSREGVGGWPDLILGGTRPSHPPYIRWRWTGQTFDKVWPPG
ncbi:hypothetical protein U5903_14090 [Cereibacter johrii]|uniref:hypothetical protein n=1 Tax=Cereibacter johrii TaxID=445629 RepID=UPI002B256C34|nr:hypothetical protein [Cereibacter johrii]MEA5161905.1 hypothetical protein [Cereibacter johrii]